MFKHTEKENRLNTEKIIDKKVVARCGINIEEKVWTISNWFVDENFQHQGHGRSTLSASIQYLLEKYGEPDEIMYVWNGENSYVFSWLDSHFKACCMMDVSAMKYKADDCWEAHVYVLDKERFLEYCRR